MRLKQKLIDWLAEIDDFLGVPEYHLNAAGAHSFKGERKFGLLSKLDELYLEEKANKHCRLLMDAYFPELGSFDAWRSAHRRSQESAFL